MLRGNADLSQIIRSFEANSTAIQTKRAGNLAKLGFSAVDHVTSDKLLSAAYRTNKIPYTARASKRICQALQALALDT